MSGTVEDPYGDPSANDDFYAEEDWDSSGVQISDSSEPYDCNDYEYDDYSYHDEYDDDFRMLTDDPAAEVTVSLVVTQPEGSIGRDSRPPGGQQHPKSAPGLRRVCQVRCREKTDHSLADCPKYLSLDLGHRWEVILKRKLCQFCLDAGHRRSQCPSETDFHHTLQRQDTHHYKPTYVQKKVIAASPLVPVEVTPVQLAIQEVKVAGRPDCVVMFDSGSQSTVVLNSYAKEAGLRKVGISNVYVKGMGGSMMEPDKIFEVPLVKRGGEVAKVYAHGVKEIVGELPPLDLTSAKKAFVRVPENEIIVPKGNVQLLIGVNRVDLHPKEVERTGRLALLLSFFGSRSKWIITGDLEGHAKGLAVVGALRQGHHVPLDFLTAEALGTETLRRCAACKKCKECQFRANVLSFKENAEYEAILNNLVYSQELKRWTASYPFVEDPNVLVDNKGQALACMRSLEKRLIKQKRLQEFNDVFQETVERGVFREITPEEMEEWEGPINYISMVEAFKQGPQATTPIRICMNSSMKQPPPHKKVPQ
jgi:hypothetical protein